MIEQVQDSFQNSLVIVFVDKTLAERRKLGIRPGFTDRLLSKTKD